MCEICSKLTLKTSELRQLSLFSVFIVNFEYISHMFLMSPMLTVNMKMLANYMADITNLFITDDHYHQS